MMMMFPEALPETVPGSSASAVDRVRCPVEGCGWLAVLGIAGRELSDWLEGNLSIQMTGCAASPQKMRAFIPVTSTVRCPHCPGPGPKAANLQFQTLPARRLSCPKQFIIVPLSFCILLPSSSHSRYLSLFLSLSVAARRPSTTVAFTGMS